MLGARAPFERLGTVAATNPATISEGTMMAKIAAAPRAFVRKPVIGAKMMKLIELNALTRP